MLEEDVIEFNADGTFVLEPVPLPSEPTTAPPGSPLKVKVLEERASLGVALWHPMDGMTGGPGSPVLD